MIRMYKLTKAGRQYSSGDLPSRRDTVLDYLHTHNRANLEEIMATTGMPKGEVLLILKKHKKDGLVVEVPEAVEV